MRPRSSQRARSLLLALLVTGPGAWPVLGAGAQGGGDPPPPPPCGLEPLPTVDADGDKVHDCIEAPLAEAGGSTVKVLVRLTEAPTPAIAATLAGLGFPVSEGFGDLRYVFVKGPAGLVQTSLAHAALPGQPSFVEMVEPDYTVQLLLDRSVRQIHADTVVDGRGVTGAGQIIAFIDTGVDALHDDFLPPGRPAEDCDLKGPHADFWGNCTRVIWFCDAVLGPCSLEAPGIPYDDHGHGTHVAGTAAGDGSASQGRLRGVAPGAEVIMIRAFSGVFGSAEAILRGYQFVQDWNERYPDRPIRVFSHSWGCVIFFCNLDGSDSLTQGLIRASEKARVFPTVAAGNWGPAKVGCPLACVPELFAVGAVDKEGNVARFSSRGPGKDGIVKPDVVAPGVDIRAPRNHPAPGQDPYRTMSGTSMATPHVAGVAALVYHAEPDLSPGQVADRLRENAHRNGEPNDDVGHGLVNAAASVGVPLEGHLPVHTCFDPATPAAVTVVVKTPNPLRLVPAGTKAVLACKAEPSPALTREVVFAGPDALSATFAFEASPAAYVLTVHPPDDFLLDATAEVVVAPLAGSAARTIVLREAGRLAIEAVGPGKQPLAGASVQVVPLGDPEAGLTTLTGSEGKATLKLAPGTYGLLVERPWMSLEGVALLPYADSVLVGAGGTHTVRATLEPPNVLEARPGPSRSVSNATPVRFAGLSFQKVDDLLADYRWDFGDGTFANLTAAEYPTQLEHRFRGVGTFNATLTVRSEDDLVDRRSATIHASEPGAWNTRTVLRDPAGDESVRAAAACTALGLPDCARLPWLDILDASVGQDATHLRLYLRLADVPGATSGFLGSDGMELNAAAEYRIEALVGTQSHRVCARVDFVRSLALPCTLRGAAVDVGFRSTTVNVVGTPPPCNLPGCDPVEDALNATADPGGFVEQTLPSDDLVTFGENDRQAVDATNDTVSFRLPRALAGAEELGVEVRVLAAETRPCTALDSNRLSFSFTEADFISTTCLGPLDLATQGLGTVWTTRPPNEAPQAAFTVSSSSIPGGGTVQFTDTSTDYEGAPLRWLWHFGNGFSSGQQHPKHGYLEAGCFAVTLTVQDEGQVWAAPASRHIVVGDSAHLCDQATGVLNGTVVSGTPPHEPVHGVKFQLVGLHGVPVEPAGISDEAGNFRLRALPGLYELRATLPEALQGAFLPRRWENVLVPGAGERDESFALAVPGTLRLDLRRPGGTPELARVDVDTSVGSLAVLGRGPQELLVPSGPATVTITPARDTLLGKRFEDIEVPAQGVLDLDGALALATVLRPQAFPRVSGVVGQELVFDATRTVAHPAATFVWNFTDGTPEVEGAVVSHAFERGGEYEVRLDATAGEQGAGDAVPAYIAEAGTRHLRRVLADPEADVDANQDGTPEQEPFTDLREVFVAVDDADLLFYLRATDLASITTRTRYTVQFEVETPSGLLVPSREFCTDQGPAPELPGADAPSNACSDDAVVDPDQDWIRFRVPRTEVSADGAVVRSIVASTRRASFPVPAADRAPDEGALVSAPYAILPAEPPPDATFALSPPAPTTLDFVTFTDGSSDLDGDLAEWAWDFGDGYTSDEQHPIHWFRDPCTCNVTLRVRDTSGQWSEATALQVAVVSAEDAPAPPVTGRLPPIMSGSASTRGPVLAGTIVNYTAVVRGPSGSPAPTGDVAFFLCGEGGCPPGEAPIQEKALPANGTVTASAPAPASVGTHCWRADYEGDARYQPDSAGSCFGVTDKVLPRLEAQSVPQGRFRLGTQVFRANATVFGDPVLGAPTGDVTFFLCPPSELAPTGCPPGAGAPVGEAPTNLTPGAANASATSHPTNATHAQEAGTHCWRVAYSGDATYAPANHTGTGPLCFSIQRPSEVVGTASPHGGPIATGSEVSDVVNVTIRGAVPGGEAKFFLCYPHDTNASGCWWGRGAQIGTPKPLSGGNATSQSWIATGPVGKYCWRVEYSGDAFYEAGGHTNSHSQCFETRRPVSIRVAPNATSLDPGNLTGATAVVTTTESTQHVTAASLLQGGPARVVQGNVTFFLCDPANATKAGCPAEQGVAIGGPRPLRNPRPEERVLNQTPSGQVAASGSAAPLEPGLHCWGVRFQASDQWHLDTYATHPSACFRVRGVPQVDLAALSVLGGFERGAVVRAVATLAAAPGLPDPTGNVSFYLCRPAEVAEEQCPPGAGAFVGRTPLVQRNATSPPTNDTLDAGRYCWRIAYEGDAVYQATAPAGSGRACFLAIQRKVRLDAFALPDPNVVAPLGAPSSAAVVVRGQTASPLLPTGTVRFFLCDPRSATEEGCPSPKGAFRGEKDLSTTHGPAVAGNLSCPGPLPAGLGQVPCAWASAPETYNTTQEGSYCWRFEYSGDEFHEPANLTDGLARCSFFSNRLRPGLDTRSEEIVPGALGVPGRPVRAVATLSGIVGRAVEGEVEFYLCGPPPLDPPTPLGCLRDRGRLHDRVPANTSVVATNTTVLSQLTVRSKDLTETLPLGKYCWRARFVPATPSLGANYSERFATDGVKSCFQSGKPDPRPSLAFSAAAVPWGGEMTATATLSKIILASGASIVATHPVPEGEVRLFLCGPAEVVVAAGCPAGGTEASETLQPQPGGTGAAASFPLNVTTLGTHCARLEYDGDGFYKPRRYADATRCFEVVLRDPAMAGASSPAGGGVPPGAPVTAHVDVTSPGVPIPPGGRVAFSLCPPIQVTAEGCPVGRGRRIGPSVALVGGSATSPPAAGPATAEVGKHCWRVEYGGDDLYAPAALTNPLAGPGGLCFVTSSLATPGVTLASAPAGVRVAPKTPVTASATVDAAGAVAFFLCSPAEATHIGCETGGRWVATETLEGGAANATVADLTTDGRHCWRAEYGGDPGHHPVHVTHEGACFEVAKFRAVITVRNGTQAGFLFKDQPANATVALAACAPEPEPPVGAPCGPPTGTVRFVLCRPSQVRTEGCPTGGSPVGDAMALLGGAAASETTTATDAIGRYCWRVDYSGDDHYLPAVGTDGAGACFEVRKP